MNMKKFLLVVSSALALAAAAAATSTSAMAASTDQEAVGNAMNRLDAAIIARDVKTLKMLTLDNLTYGHSSGLVQDKATFLDKIATGPTHNTRIDLSNVSTAVTGDVAIVRNHYSGTVESGGKQSDVDFDVLMTWKKQHGAWKLLARQGYKH